MNLAARGNWSGPCSARPATRRVRRAWCSSIMLAIWAVCGHGLMGVVVTLAHLGRIGPGIHRLETPVGEVSAHAARRRSVSVENVASYRHRQAATVDRAGPRTGHGRRGVGRPTGSS